MSMKIIIIGSTDTDKYAIAKSLQKADDDLSISPVFSTDINMRGKITDNLIYYMPNEEVELSYKNNAFMWVHSTDGGSTGVTMSDMYDSDIFVMNFGDFNNMSLPVLNEISKDDNCVICFIDTKAKRNKDDIRESQFALERVFSTDRYLYFLDDSVDSVTQAILDYITGTPEEKRKIAEALNS